jgi:uridine kinase
MTRAEILSQLAGMIAGRKRPHPVRVGIDGIDGSGKTRLAEELASVLQALGRPVIRASLDRFHQPREVRHRQGRYSPKGYFEDSFNYPVLRSDILVPLGPRGSLRYRSAHFDYPLDSETEEPWRDAAPDSILLFDGVFLKRPELAGDWDYHVFVDCGFKTAIERVLRRDLDLFGPEEEVRKLYRKRFFPGQLLYLSQCRPQDSADVFLKNDDFANPRLLTRS